MRSSTAPTSTADGQPVELRPTGIRTVTALVRDGRTVASLVHRRGLLDNPVLVDEVVAAAGLALENERLHAELRAQERELRASRARIVEAGDAERQRLERNLHDGSQQRLIGLLLSARYAQSLLGRGSSPTTRATVDGLTAGLTAAVDELRRIAHGIYPAVLSDEGLAAAIDSLADDDETLAIGSIPDERFGPAVENAAYRVVAEVARSGPTRVCAARRDGMLVLDVESERLPDGLVDLEDRVGAVEGVLRASEAPIRCRHDQGGTAMRVAIADDSMLLREGLARLLTESGFDVIAKVATGADLLRHVSHDEPDVVIVDIKMPPTHTDEGIVTAQAIRRDHPAVGVLVLSQYLDAEYAVRVLEDVPDRVGYLLKERVSDMAVLADALQRIDEGECVVDPTIVSRLFKRRREHRPLDVLTDRERGVLTMMAEGRTNQAIAHSLFMSAKTVENHVHQIFQKLRLEPSPDDHRRVLAVLMLLRSDGASEPA